MKKVFLLFCFVLILLTGCNGEPEQLLPTLIPTADIPVSPTLEQQARVTLTPVVTLPAVIPTPTNTPLPTNTATMIPPEIAAVPSPVEPTPALTMPTVTALEDSDPSFRITDTVDPTPTYWPTVTRQVLSAAESAGLVPCENRDVPPDFLVFATQQFSLPESYTPPNMVLTTDFFDSSVTLDNPQFIRQTILEPLQRMIGEMHALGIRPSIISAYRSYNEQALAWHWWSSQYPGRVAILSARPGRSEHQLGTTIDFGSPELNHLFHVDFANSAEGVWLAKNAYRFGFTLSYPPYTEYITGYKHEPWHYRYIGAEMAEYLYNAGQILTSWQIANLDPPCIP